MSHTEGVWKEFFIQVMRLYVENRVGFPNWFPPTPKKSSREQRKETAFEFLWWLEGGAGVRVLREKASTVWTSCCHQGGSTQDFLLICSYVEQKRKTKHQKMESDPISLLASLLSSSFSSFLPTSSFLPPFLPSFLPSLPPRSFLPFFFVCKLYFSIVCHPFFILFSPLSFWFRIVMYLLSDYELVEKVQPFSQYSKQDNLPKAATLISHAFCFPGIGLGRIFFPSEHPQ